MSDLWTIFIWCFGLKNICCLFVYRFIVGFYSPIVDGNLYSALLFFPKSTTFKRRSQRNKYSYFWTTNWKAAKKITKKAKHLWKNFKKHINNQSTALKWNTTQNKDFNMKTMNRIVWDEDDQRRYFNSSRRNGSKKEQNDSQVSFPFTCKF